jgi:predicted AlkP superfamily phosphohydrolase/phosphomutase
MAEVAGAEVPGVAPPRVLLIGLDGADLRKLDELAAADRLPNLSALMARGVHGLLETVANASPIVWTSVATGVVPEKHGIEFFRLGGEPAASTMRKRPAFWNILSHYGRSVGVLAWWASFPAERVRGYLVSPYVLLMPPRGTETRVESFWDPGDPRKTHPPELQRDLADLVYLDEDLDLGSMPELYADRERTTNTGWALAKDLSYYDMARRLLVERPVDLVAVYFQGIDAGSHDFDRHVHGANVNEAREPRVDAAEVEAAMGRVDAMYEKMDELVGGLVAHAGSETDVLVVSDHGWNYDGTSHWNDDPGIFVAAGPSFAARGRFEGLSVLDVTPILLAILRAPLSRDFDGDVPEGLLSEGIASAVEWVEAYPFPPVALAAGTESTAPEDEAMLERLRSLGYISDD